MKVFFALLSVFALAQAATLSTLIERTSHYRVRDEAAFSNQERHVGRIVGGEEAAPGQFPYIVSMQWSGFGHYCGAFVLNDRYAGTAAHCLEGDTEEDLPWMSAHVNMIHVREGTAFPIVAFWMHPEYDVAYFLDLDVGAFRIDGSFSSANAFPIALNREDPAPGTDVDISGWGRLESGGQSPDELQWATTAIFDRDECLAHYETDVTINNICAMREGIDTCQGDSGGPLTIRGSDPRQDLLAGIVSWGFGCAHPDFAGVYVNVASAPVLEYLDAFINADEIDPLL